MSNEYWEQQLACVGCNRDIRRVVSTFQEYMLHNYYRPWTYDLLEYHRDFRKFIDAFCKYWHIFTKLTSVELYRIIDLCSDVTIYRKMFAHGMKMYRDEVDYLIATSTSHLVAFVETDEKNVYVEYEIDHILHRLTFSRFAGLETTIDLCFLIEASV